MSEQSVADVLQGRCGACAHACLMPHPGPEPVINPAPTRDGFWGWLFGGEDIFERFERTYPKSRWDSRKAQFDNFVTCQRFPETVEKAKAETCGEYSPAATLAEERG